MKRKRLPLKTTLEIAKKEEEFPQAPLRSVPEKPAVQQQAAPVKRSTLLKGLRSVDIVVPEQGTRYCFQKLGGNPTMTLTYRKKGIFSKLLSLLVLLAATAGTLRVRRWQLPVERITGFFKGKSLSDYHGRFMQSWLVKVIPTFIMVAGIFLGLPWFVMGVGLNTALLLRYLSRKRYEKKGYEPPHNYIVFFKYLLSYIILASSFLLIITAFHPAFLVSLTVSTILNCVYVAAYAIVYVFTRRTDDRPP